MLLQHLRRCIRAQHMTHENRKVKINYLLILYQGLENHIDFTGKNFAGDEGKPVYQVIETERHL